MENIFEKNERDANKFMIVSGHLRFFCEASFFKFLTASGVYI